MNKTFFVMCLVMVSMGLNGQNSLKTGDKAPAFSATSDEGVLWSLKDYVGNKNVVIFFYPAAMTGGCTKQACSYRDHLGALSAVDAIVVGVSGDDVAALQVFRKAHDLNFTLLSDFDGAVASKYGVPTRDGGSLTRKIDDLDVVLNRGVTASRWTFVIGKDGTIKYINQQVDAENDYQAVLQALKQ